MVLEFDWVDFERGWILNVSRLIKLYCSVECRNLMIVRIIRPMYKKIVKTVGKFFLKVKVLKNNK